MMDKEAFVQRVMAREQALYRVARAMLPRPVDQQDAVQEAVLKAWAKRDTLREEAVFPAWLMRILINECKTIRRKASRLVLTDAWAEQAASAVPADDALALDALVDALPEKLRLPVVLYYVEDFPLNTVAAILRCPPGTIKRRLYDARKALRLEMEQEKEAWER